MILETTSRLIMKSNMVIKNKELISPNNSNSKIKLLEIQPNRVEDNGFVFYLQEETTVEVCHIAITLQRDKFEFVYETKEEFRNKGYMTEALSFTSNWIIDNTNINEIWALINLNPASEKVLQKSNFKYIPDINSPYKWYVYSK